MTRGTVIDLEKLPAPDIVETLNFETIFAEILADLRLRLPELTIELESDPTYKILEAAAYRELILRSRINDASRAVMLAYAARVDLDNIAVRFNVGRDVVSPGDPDATPPVPARFELDERLRRRTKLAFEGLSTAGPVSSYLFHALGANALVKDVDVSSPSPGDVVVTILSYENKGVPSNMVLEGIRAVLNAEDIRPLTDRVTVQAPEILF